MHLHGDEFAIRNFRNEGSGVRHAHWAGSSWLFHVIFWTFIHLGIWFVMTSVDVCLFLVLAVEGV